MAEDIFGRIVSIDKNVSEIKAQLLQSVNTKTATTSSSSDEPVEKLIKQIDTITGYKLDDELKKFKDSLEEIRKIYDDMAKKRNQRKNSGSTSSGLTSASESLKKSLKKVINQTEASLVDFGSKITEALEKTVNQISKAAGVGKIPGAPSAAKRSTRDLCECICACLERDRKAENKANAKENKKNRDAMKAKGGGGVGGVGGGKGGLLPRPPSGGDTYLHEFLKWRGKEKEKPNYRQWGVNAAGGIQKALQSENAVGETLGVVADTVANSVGGLISKIGRAFGDVPFVGDAIAQLGDLFGGMAEGFLKLVLQPLAKQIDYFGRTSAAMFATTGAGRGDFQMDLGPAPGADQAGKDWTLLSKRIADYNAGLDTASHRLEKFSFTTSDILTTGQRLTTIQERQLKNYRKGISETTKLYKVTRVGLQTATLIDAKAEDTAELFADWTQNLGLSNNQIGIMGRSLRDIAVRSGIFGDNLINVAKSANTFMEKMRMAGTFTTASAQNIIGMLASAQKTGTSKGMTNLLEMMTSSALFKTGPLSDLARVAAGLSGGGQGMIDKLLGGTLTDSKESMSQFADGLERALGQFIQIRPGETIAQAIGKMSNEEKGRVSAMMQNLYGVGLKELELLIGNIRDNAKTFGQRLEEINKQTVKLEAGGMNKRMEAEEVSAKFAAQGADWQKKWNDALKNNANDMAKTMQEFMRSKDLPEELRNSLRGQIRLQEAHQQKEALIFNTGDKLINKFNENLENGLGFKDAIAKLGGDKDFREYFKSLGTDAQQGGEALKKALQSQADILNKQAKMLGVTGLNINPKEIEDAIAAAQTGDKGPMETLAGKMGEIKDALQVEAKASVDPVFKIERILKRIEGYFQLMMAQGIASGAPIINALIEGLEKEKWVSSLSKAFESGKPEDFAQATKEFGEWMKNLPADAKKFLAESKMLPPGLMDSLQKGFAGFTGEMANIWGPLFETLGAAIEKYGPKVVESFIKVLQDALKIEDLPQKIGQLLADFTSFVAILGTLATIVTVGGPMLTGIAALIGGGGLGGLGMLLLGGGIVLGIGAIIKELNHWEGVMEKFNVEFKDRIVKMRKDMIEAFSGKKPEEMAKTVSDAELQDKEKKRQAAEASRAAGQKMLEDSIMTRFLPSTRKTRGILLDVAEERKRHLEVERLEIEYAQNLKAANGDWVKAGKLKEVFQEKVAEQLGGNLKWPAFEQLQAETFEDFNAATARVEEWMVKQRARAADYREKAKHPMDSSSIGYAQSVEKNIRVHQERMQLVKERALEQLLTRFGNNVDSVATVLQETVKEISPESEKTFAGSKSAEELEARYKKERDYLNKLYQEAKTDKGEIDYVKRYEIAMRLAKVANTFEKAAKPFEDIAADAATARRAKELVGGTTDLDKLVAKVRTGTGDRPGLVGGGFQSGVYEKFKTEAEARSKLDEAGKALGKAFSEAKTEEKKLQIAEEMARHMNAFQEAQQRLTNAGMKTGSIYTHDENLANILSEMSAHIYTISASLPGIDVEEEIKKRQMNAGSGTNEIVANTGETAENTRRTAVLMGALLNCFRRAGRRTGATTIEGENLDESAFFDQFIDCDWVDTTARSTAYVWRQGNIGKKN